MTEWLRSWFRRHPVALLAQIVRMETWKGVVNFRFSGWVKTSDPSLDFLRFIFGPWSVWMTVLTRPLYLVSVHALRTVPTAGLCVFLMRREAPPTAALLHFRNSQHDQSVRICELTAFFWLRWVYNFPFLKPRRVVMSEKTFWEALGSARLSKHFHLRYSGSRKHTATLLGQQLLAFLVAFLSSWASRVIGDKESRRESYSWKRQLAFDASYP